MSYVTDHMNQEESSLYSLIFYVNEKCNNYVRKENIFFEGHNENTLMPGRFLIKGKDGKWFIQSMDRQWHNDKIIFERARDAFSVYYYMTMKNRPSMYDYLKEWEKETGLEF